MSKVAIHSKTAGSTPISPPFGPATGSFNGLHPKSNFLAIGGGRSPAQRPVNEGA